MDNMLSEKHRCRVVDTWLGPVAYIACSGKLVRVYLPTQRSYHIANVGKEFPGCREDDTLLNGLAKQLADYFAGRLRRFSVPIALEGSDFRGQVLRETRKIPFGRTLSYGQIAERIGRPRACRAVGMALGANPVPLVIPCHRVIAADGTLGGFSCGLAVKRRLLTHERSCVQ